MRYSLLSRVRGTLLGAAAGEIFGSQWEGRAQSERSSLKLGVKQLGSNLVAEARLHPWGRVATLGAQSLISLGRFDLDDWCYAQKSVESGNNVFSQSHATDRVNRVSTKAVIATLPLIIFYHENEIKLRQNLQQLVDLWQHDPVKTIHEVPIIVDSALAVGYAIAQSLTEKLNPAELIAQTITFLGETPTQVAQQLLQVQTLLEQGAGLEKAVSQLSRDTQFSTPIALAFYCFLSTLEDLQISVRRAAQTRYQPQITSAITGALSGAYNSTAGIPVSWRMVLSRPEAKPMAAWGMETELEMLELSDSLVAVWSGVYSQTAYPTDLTPVAAVAAPRVIRLR